MKKLFLFAAVVMAAVSCDRTPSLVILHCNDTHSHLECGRFGKYAGKGGIIERAAYVDSVRAAMGENRVLLLHAGDFNQGSSYYTQLKGELEVNLVNAMRYDCIALGNHEFDSGIEDLTERVKKMDCPVVCCNLDLRSFELGDYVKPYVILNRGGKKIGIVGAITELGRNVLKSVASRVPAYDLVEKVNEYTEELHAAGCDMIILLSHLGYKEDCELVPLTHHVDIVVGGHSHTFLDGITWVKDSDSRKVAIVTDGQYGVQMGEVKVY